MSEEQKPFIGGMEVKSPWYIAMWPSTCLGWTKLIASILLIFIVLLFIVASVIPDSPIQAWLLDVVNWIDNINIWIAAVAMFGLYLVLVPLGVPITPLNLVGGYLFGFLFGCLVSITSSLCGCLVCYVLARTLFQEWVDRKMQEKRIYIALYNATQKNSMKLIILTHISPILPATLLNYLFSAFGVSFAVYTVATLIGISPLIIVYCLFGSLAMSLQNAWSGGDTNSIWFTIGLGILVVITSVVIVGAVYFYVKKELKDTMKAMEEEEIVVVDDDAALMS